MQKFNEYVWDGKNRDVTSVSQGLELSKKGLGIESADYAYLPGGLGKLIPRTPENHNAPGLIPAWSLSRLLEIMPEMIQSDYTTISGSKIEYFLSSWTARSYMYENAVESGWCSSDVPKRLHYEIGETWTDAAVKMIIWLIDNNYDLSRPKERMD